MVIGVSAPAENAGLEAYANAVSCRPLGRVPAKYPQDDSLFYYAFAVPNDGTLPPVTVAEFGATNEQAEIHWCELQVL